jgi:hypothetical protein
MAVVASATVAAVFGLGAGTLAAGLAGGALLGAGAGALYSGITGDGNILNSALTGAFLGGAAGGLGAAFAPALTPASALASAPVSTALVPTANAITAVPAAQAAGLTAGTGATGGLSAAAKGAAGLSAAAPTVAAAPSLASLTTPAVTGSLIPAGYGAGSTAAGMSGSKMLGYGLAGTTALSLLGGRQQGSGAGQMPDPGMVRPYEYSSIPNEATGIYPSPYATASYDEAGNPILDTRERNYFNQSFTAMQPYSAKTGTVNPNIEPVTMAARGGVMVDDESGMDEARGLMQGNLQKGLFGQGYAAGGQIGTSTGYGALANLNLPGLNGPLGAVGDQRQTGMQPMGSSSGINPFSQERMAALNNNRNVMRVQGGGYDEQGRGVDGFGNVIERTAPSGEPFSQVMGGLSSMFPGTAKTAPLLDIQGRNAQYRTAQEEAQMDQQPFYPQATDSYNTNPNINTNSFAGPKANYGGGFGGFGGGFGGGGGPFPLEGQYGIVKMAEGGEVKHMFSGGLSAMISKMFKNNPEMLAKYEYDKTNQRYSTVPRPQQSQGIFERMFGGAMGAGDTGLPAYRFDPAAQEYQALAAGGHLGGYSDGGRMLKGPGDGMSDDIPGVIGNKQPARLADGEFVVPADVVSHLGNGSTDAGAKRLYAMMDEVRKARTGNKKQGKKIKAEKYLPA